MNLKMNWNEIEIKTLELRNCLLATLTSLLKESEPDNIPDISKSIHVAHELLAKLNFDVVVCGEVKKGKSTFINALIGQDVLPTGLQETTSQVFRITNSDKESFSLVFTDGSDETISRNELSKYGSQIDADLMGEPIFKDRQLDYIQVNIPFEFLPKRVSIVDTPGLGALYKSHEQITNRYIQNAAAVVFVFEPSQPMVVQEKTFLQKVFAVTPYVMFVMTQIDKYDEAHWIDQISRSETLLKESFGEKCYVVPKIFPMASITLLGASQIKEKDEKEEQVEVSYFPEVKEELSRIMYQIVALSRNQFAYNEAVKQKERVLTSIDEQLRMITATTKDEQERIKKEKAKKRSTFEKTWGPASVKRKEVIQEVQTIIGSIHNRAARITSSTGTVFKKYYAQIEKLNSIDEINAFSDKVSKSIIKDVSSEWQDIANVAQRDIMISLNMLKAKMDEVANPSSFSAPDSVKIMGLTSSEKFQSYKTKYFDAAVTTGVGASLLGLAGIAMAPIAPLILIGVVLYGFFSGGNEAERREIEKNKANLKSSLSNMLNEIHSQMFLSPIPGGHLTMVQKFTSDLMTSVEKAMAAMFEAEKNRFDTELKLLDEQSSMGTELRQKELIRLNEQRKNWLYIATELESEEKILSQIQTALK
jgi:GTPase Era involved in 16S rRNA processing